MTRAAVLIGFVLLAGTLVFWPVELRADDVADLIEAMKPSPLDHAVWAEKLLKAAQDLNTDTKAQVRVYEAAYERGIKQAKGYAVAVRAARVILAAKPEERSTWQQKLLNACKLDWQAARRGRKKQAGETYADQLIEVADAHAAGGELSEAIKVYTSAANVVRHYVPRRTEEVLGKLRDARERDKTHKQVARYKRLLAKDTKNVLTREKLIRMYLVDLDSPDEARKLLTADVSEMWRTYVPLAAAKLTEVPKLRLTTLLNNIRNWRITNGKWAQQRGKIIGAGDSLLTFNRPIPGNCVLELRLNVISGARPRIHVGKDLYVGNRIPGRRLTIRGASKTQGKPRPYSHNKPMNLRIVLQGESIELYVDQTKVVAGTRTPVKETTLAISAGDSHNKGTMEFYSFKLTPLKGDGK